MQTLMYKVKKNISAIALTLVISDLKFTFSNLAQNSLSWLLLVVLLYRLFPSKVLLFYLLYLPKGRKWSKTKNTVRRAQKQGWEAYKNVGMEKRASSQAWKWERDRKVAEVRQRESDETHTCTKLPEPSLLIPQQPSQKLLCFPGENASHQRAITARLHSNTLQQYRCSAVVGR